MNLVPTSTGAAKPSACVLPELNGKLHGFHHPGARHHGLRRRPHLRGRARDQRRRAQRRLQGRRGRPEGDPALNEDPIVSTDIIGDEHSSIVDAPLTAVINGTLVKVVSWYDNEWWDTAASTSFRRCCENAQRHRGRRQARPRARRLNVPHEGEITDDTRIRAALPTMVCASTGRACCSASHLGRPKGRDESFSLAPVAARLGELLGTEVPARAKRFDHVPPTATSQMLENIRFEPGETKNDPDSPRAPGRAAMSTSTTPSGRRTARTPRPRASRTCPPARPGLLLQRGRDADRDPRPLVAIVAGGAKVTDKIGVLEAFLQRADAIRIGGANRPSRSSPCRATRSATRCARRTSTPARELLERGSDELRLPVDLVLGRAFDADTERRDVDGVDVPDGWMGLDIGPRTAEAYGEEIAAAGTVFWNGPWRLRGWNRGRHPRGRGRASARRDRVVGGGDSSAALADRGRCVTRAHRGQDAPGVEVLS